MLLKTNVSGQPNYSIISNLTFNPNGNERERDLVRGVFFLVFTIVGVILNLFIVVAVRNRRILNVRNILLIHLGSVGLAAAILCLLFTAVVSFSGWRSGYWTVCQIQGLLQAILTQVTTWTLAAISWDKYQTIVSPFQHSNVAPIRKMLVLFSVMWITALIIGIPPLFYENGYVYHRTLGSCFVNTPTPSKHHWYSGLVVCVLFYAPLCVMLYSYAHIYRIARTQSSRIAATMIRMACVVQAPLAINGQTAGAGPATMKGKKAMLTILQLLGTFMLTYIPFSVLFVAGICGLNVCNYPVLVAVFSTIYQAAPVTNGAIYGIRNKLLRNSFRRYVRRRIQQLCYKDKRRNSVKRTSSFRLSVMQRKNQPNGNSQPGLRRTQSLQAKHIRSPSPNLLQLHGEDRIKKAQSFTLANGHTMAFLDPNILSAPANEISNDSVTPLEVLAESEQDRDDP